MGSKRLRLTRSGRRSPVVWQSHHHRDKGAQDGCAEQGWPQGLGVQTRRSPRRNRAVQKRETAVVPSVDGNTTGTRITCMDGTASTKVS